MLLMKYQTFSRIINLKCLVNQNILHKILINFIHFFIMIVASFLWIISSVKSKKCTKIVNLDLPHL